MSQIGDNGADNEIERRAQRRVDKLDEIAALQEELKLFKSEDKADGFTEQAMAQAVKELRADAKARAKRLTLEAEITAYRGAVGLPTTVEQAYAEAQAAADTVPEPKSKKKRGGDE